jgi:hypothetical protein
MITKLGQRMVQDDGSEPNPGDQDSGGDEIGDITPPGASLSSRYEHRTPRVAGVGRMPHAKDARSLAAPLRERASARNAVGTPIKAAAGKDGAWEIQSGRALPVRGKVDSTGNVAVELSLLETAEFLSGAKNIAKATLKLARPGIGPKLDAGADKHGKYVSVGVEAGMPFVAELAHSVKIYPSNLLESKFETTVSGLIMAKSMPGPSLRDVYSICQDWYGEATKRLQIPNSIGY